MSAEFRITDQLLKSVETAGYKDNIQVDKLLADLVEKDCLTDPASLTQAQSDAVVSLLALKEQQLVLISEREKQLQRIRKRCSAEQWLDENEREWKAMDRLMASRPWALKKEKPFKYPFREATNRMRAIEGPWLGDDEYTGLADTRGEAVSAVLTNLRPVAEFPAESRVVLFAPEFGSEESFLLRTWQHLEPKETCDMWLVSWQGWASFSEMIEHVFRKVMSLADGVSTVWYAHSFGAIVAYEVLKRFEGRELPNLPVALIVSGCCAPDAMSSSTSATGAFPWLWTVKTPADVAALSEEQLKELKVQFGWAGRSGDQPGEGLQSQMARLLNNFMKKRGKSGELELLEEFGGVSGMKSVPPAHHASISGDLKVISSYKFDTKREGRLLIPVVAIDHDEDKLVLPDEVARWQDFAPQGKFEAFHLDQEDEDVEALALQGHGYAFDPVPALIKIISRTASKYRLNKVEEAFDDVGPTDGDLPEEIDVCVVGAGIAGIGNAKVHKEHGKSVVVLDKYSAIGGIWKFYANKFSRVNSSEPAYRLFDQTGPAARPNEDHSPTFDIMRDIHSLAAEKNKGDFRLNWEVLKVQKDAMGMYVVKCRNVKDARLQQVRAKAVSLHVNRRIGDRRDVTWPGSRQFKGEEVYGYANEVLGLKFWGKRVIVVGAGAFAYENLRTALEHGAKHVTLLGRRSGTTCPKWIDMIAFLRPIADIKWNMNKACNVISYEAWRQCYLDANLPTPECWKDGLLKPHNHTVSVSDLAFIAGYYGLATLKVGEIEKFKADGQGVILKDGTKIDADVIIKATGFHINRSVPPMTGKDRIHSWGSLDYNLVYGAEPILDGGQFGSQKGRVVLDRRDEDDASQTALDVEEVTQTLKELKLSRIPDLNVVGVSFSNPFGSAYIGHMLFQARFNAYLLANPEVQQALLRSAGQGKLDTVDLWASQAGQSHGLELKNVLFSLQGK